MKKIILSLALVVLMTGCVLDDIGNLGDLNSTSEVENNTSAGDQVTPNRPDTAPVETDSQTTPSRPGTIPVTVDDTFPAEDILDLPPGDAITYIDSDYGFLEDSTFIEISSVVHNTTRGEYITSSGPYILVKYEIGQGESANVSVSTRPNCSIRAILSPYEVEGTNAIIDRADRSYGSYNMEKVGVFTGRDPFGISVTNNSESKILYMYFSIDNDNTRSYFNKEACVLGISVN